MEELLSKNAPEALELINQIKQYRQVDNTKHFDAACDLFDLAQECGNEDLKDFASCALGDACCQKGEYSQALYYLSAGINGLEKTDEYRLICRTYNELGVIFRTQSHYITSEEFFLNAIEIARANRLYAQEAISCSNFASLCAEMDAIERALEYHYRAIECCKFIDDNDLKYELIVGDYAFIMKLYVQLDDRANAEIALNEIENIITEYPELSEFYDIIIAKLIYYRYVKDVDNRAQYKALCLDAFYDCDNYIVYFDEAKELMKYLLEDEDFDELEKVFERINSMVKDDVLDLRLSMEDCKIQMYGKLGNTVRLTESLKKYHILNERKAEDKKRAFLTTLRLKSELAQQRTKNLFLSEAAETDPLTGIANRLKLNNVIDELFIMANEEGKNLGVEMLDVDCFKCVNDTYGHAKGDELLIELGKILKSLVTDKIFVARYGGDEFIIYYYDMTDEEILAEAKHIGEAMTEAGRRMNLENVSLSQGIVNHIPRPLNRAWDYMNAADLALYFVKNHGKANARLIHRATEIETLSWENKL